MLSMLSHTRQSVTFKIQNLSEFKHQAIAWANQFDTVTYLDSNSYANRNHGKYEALMGVGNEVELLSATAKGAFDDLKHFYETQQDWLFGFLGYDLKNDVEKLTSLNEDQLDFPEMHFYVPSIVIEVFENEITIHSKSNNPTLIFQEIMSYDAVFDATKNKVGKLQAKIKKQDYLDTVQKIKDHIIDGDIYEMNFCQEFYAADSTINPLATFWELNEIGQAPFSAYYKHADRYLLCASPERFVKKVANKIISQPIKGTIKRGHTAFEDEALRTELYNSEKDRAENVMIVDLVRNDFARSCQAGTVKVEELFGIYGFGQVYQMISTVVGELREEVHFVDAIKNAFPMGSMTGAPKVMSMELIEHYEQSKRGLYSGAVGYITPEGDFDFNVQTKYLAFQVGGAIVYDSVPELEYEECLLKAKGMMKVLGKSIQGL